MCVAQDEAKLSFRVLEEQVDQSLEIVIVCERVAPELGEGAPFLFSIIFSIICKDSKLGSG